MVMAEENQVVPLSRLSRGLCTYYIVVKIDRIIYKELLSFAAGPNNPVKEQVAVQLIVFDEAQDRMLVVIDDCAVMRRFARMLLPEKVYRMSHFLVRLNHDPDREKFHLNLTHLSVVERHDADLPEHSWDIVTVTHVIHGLGVGDGLIGLCGFLVSLYELPMDDDSGYYSRHVTLLLEDKGVFSIGETKVLACVVKGGAADLAMEQPYLFMGSPWSSLIRMQQGPFSIHNFQSLM